MQSPSRCSTEWPCEVTCRYRQPSHRAPRPLTHRLHLLHRAGALLQRRKQALLVLSGLQVEQLQRGEGRGGVAGALRQRCSENRPSGACGRAGALLLLLFRTCTVCS